MAIEVTKSNGILTLEFNRIERKNAITSAMYQTLADALNAAQGDNEVRAILLTGKPEVFTAGNDLEDFMKTTATYTGAFADRPVFQFMRALSGSAKPVVAAVGGLAIGIGTTLLMHCDLVYAGDSAKFSVPFSQLGLCPEFGSSLLMPLAGGHARAAEKLMLGEPFTAQEAYDMGIVSKVVPAAEVLEHARNQALKLVALPAGSIRTTKRLMTSTRKAQLEAVIAEESKLFFEMLQGAEAKEAFTAFFEKRKPDFSKFA
ncbi:enoyl-CoA hydratase/carnithine racemase [Pseudoduganella flava]|uniref:Enoyl-CoA hydratase n=1 Tax=Pseudoduganella flava TaxID=871742 RepID=A0A562PMX2_9BURK|nr:enoyl-CoA hydratase [Pseudoduganella flava]QGZ40916.1 enoyl-CoA hydratase [Pseudoduganella flava]TWI45406.1 enoyl-CoA hydratase/carnithine racemase [Pseudoduganella flava]